MTVLITGGAGFIGSAFVRHAVQSGLDTAVIDKLTYAGDLARLAQVIDKIKFYRIDVTDVPMLEEVFSKERPDVIVHFAAETHVDRSIINPREFILSNVAGTANLLELSVGHSVKKFIHVSTDEVYGDILSDKGSIFKETDCLLPNSPYSASKAGADMVVRSFTKTYGLASVIVRPSNNYGPWQYPEKLLPLTIAKILLDERIPVYGKGANIRTWLFVEDCVKAILRLIQDGQSGEIYNIGSGEEKRNIDVVRDLLKLLGKDESLIEFVADRPGHDYRYAVETSKISEHTGWRPETTFEEGLKSTVAWYLDNKEWLLRKKNEAERFVKLIKEEYRKVNI
ncbi:MAG: dTDP-glucose 4,6-dehydratase [Dissulfurispiraceae bacterium]